MAGFSCGVRMGSIWFFVPPKPSSLGSRSSLCTVQAAGAWRQGAFNAASAGCGDAFHAVASCLLVRQDSTCSLLLACLPSDMCVPAYIAWWACVCSELALHPGGK